MIKILLALLFLIPATISSANMIGIQGIYLGKQEEGVRKAVEKIGENVECSIDRCNAKISIKGHLALAQFQFTGDILNEVEIWASIHSFTDIYTALVEKYGQPDSTNTVILSNKFGATREQASYWWHGVNGDIIAKDFSTSKPFAPYSKMKSDFCYINLLSQETIAKFKTELEKRKKSPGF